MTRPDVGCHTTDSAHNMDEPGVRRAREIEEATNEEARREARLRIRRMTWLQDFIRRMEVNRGK